MPTIDPESALAALQDGEQIETLVIVRVEWSRSKVEQAIRKFGGAVRLNVGPLIGVASPEFVGRYVYFRTKEK